MSLSTPTIEAQGLCKAYVRGGARTQVLNQVDLVAWPGECLFLAGPSGSGKTTLLSILGCILSPDAGELRVAGHDLRRLSAEKRAELRRDHIGFVFQRFHLIRGLNALDNVCVPLLLRGMSRRQASRRASELLAMVGLGEKKSNHPTQLSVGQCQRVALARALVGDPEVILADEPTASLDAHTGLEVMRLLRRLTAESGKTAIVVTHDARIFSFADRVLHLEEGRVRASVEDHELAEAVAQAEIAHA